MSVLFNRRQWLKTGMLTTAALAISPASFRGEVAAQNAQTVIRLSSNENPYGLSPKARRAVLDSLGEGNRYAGAEEVAGLERMIAERENLPVESVVLGTGSGEVLCMAAAYGLDRGEIVAADPTFGWMLRYASNLGAKVERVPLDENFRHDLNGMSRRVSSNTKLIYICNPSNPTATIVQPAQLRQFCEDVAPRAAVLVDEAYLEYVPDFPASSTVDLVRRGKNVIVLRTFSKIYGMAGLRVGYGLAKPEIASRLKQFRMTWLNKISLRAATASLQDTDFVQQSRRKNAEVREYLYREFDRMEIRYAASSANFMWFHVGRENRDLPAKFARFGVQITGAGSQPLEWDWGRTTIGTMDEMKVFVQALGSVLKS